MLTRTFVHLPGVGPASEKKFWDRGIQNWDGLRALSKSIFGQSKAAIIEKYLDDSEVALAQGDLTFFFENFPRPELWRLVPNYLDDIAYLDIETNGLALPPYSQSTTITFYFRGQVYQEHEHAKKELLVRKMVDEAKVFCTYFGEVFDLPFLRKEFSLEIRKAHLDLCFWMRRLGFSGGLKKVQTLFDDIPRREFDIEGLDAVRLWKFHLDGIPGALDTLLAYNAEDTVVLEALLVKAFNLEIGKRPHLGLTELNVRPYPTIPTSVSMEIYEKLRTTSVSPSW